MEKELRMLLALLPCKKEETVNGTTFFHSGFSAGMELVIARCGIGKVNSAVTASEMIRLHKPDFIVSTGVAGGAQTDVMPLQTVVGETMVYHDVYCGDDCICGQIPPFPAVMKADARLISIAKGMPGLRIGMIATGDWFVNTREKALEILSKHPAAIAFDMESCAIAQVCYMRSCPFISFRVISDNPLSEKGQEQYDGFWQRLADGSLGTLVEFLRKC